MRDDSRIRDILDTAADLLRAQRQAYLDSACGGDAGLRAEVESLLRALTEADEFLVNPTVGEPAPPPATTPAPGTVIGPYRLIEKLGDGGMGVVYLAEQDRPVRRLVALKIIKPGMDSGAVVARFQAERQALALMDHTNIARVYDVGTTDTGHPYFVMELVEGVPVTKYCDDHRLTPAQRLELFIPICQAVQHAHQKGIIHRDLKPGNVLVSVQDGRPVVKVIDFGIAKAIDQQLTEMAAFTQLGAFIGTPEYMSPEQAGGDPKQTDTRSDIYSLGVLLYELLTGTTPLDRRQLREAGYEQMMRTIREVEPPRPSTRLSVANDGTASASALRRTEPRKLAKTLLGDLDLIVMKCLAKDRARRYETASGLARDIERFLNDDPVEACPPSVLYVLGKLGWKYRRPLTVAAAFALLVTGCLVTTSVVFSVLKNEASRQRDVAVGARLAESVAKDEALAGRDAAEREQAEAEHESYRASVFAAGAAVASDNFGNANQFLDNAPGPLRNWEWGYLHAAANPQLLTLHVPRLDRAFYPDGKAEIVAFDGDRVVHYFDLQTGRERRTLTALKEQGLRPFAIAPDEQRFLAEHADLSIAVLDGDGRELVSIPKATQSLTYVYTTLFTRDHARFVTAARDDPGIRPPQVDHPVRVWDTATGHELLKLDVQSGQVISTALSADETKLVTGSVDGVSQVWDLANGKCLSTYRDPARNWIASGFSPDGKRVVSSTASLGRQGVIWDATAPVGVEKNVLREGFHANYNMAAEFSPDGRRVVLSGGKFASVFDAQSGVLVARLSSHLGRVPGASFIGDGSRVMTASNDDTIRIWDLLARDRPPAFGDAAHRIVSVDFDPGGDSLVTIGTDSVARSYDASTHALRYAVSARDGRFETPLDAPVKAPPTRPAPVPGDVAARVALPAGDGSVRVLDAVTGDVVSRIGDAVPGGPSVVTAFTHDSGRAVTGSALGTIRVWDVVSGRATATLRLFGGRVDRLLISPTGDRLLTADGGRVTLWDLQSNRPVGTLGENPIAFTFSHNGRFVAVTQPAGTAIFDAATGKQTALLYSHVSAVLSAAFSADDARLVLSCQDEVAEIWDAERHRRLLTLFGHQGAVLGSVFSPDDSRVLTCSLDGTARVWDADRGEELLALQGHSAAVTKAVFSRDGSKILTLSLDGTARVWDSKSTEEKRAAPQQ